MFFAIFFYQQHSLYAWFIIPYVIISECGPLLIVVSGQHLHRKENDKKLYFIRPSCKVVILLIFLNTINFGYVSRVFLKMIVILHFIKIDLL